MNNQLIDREKLQDLRGYELNVYCIINIWKEDKNQVEVSYSKLSEMLGVSYRTIARAMKALIDKGYVEKISNSGPYAPIFRVIK